MSLGKEQFIQELAVFIEAETEWIIADLQKKRFENQGAFNGHEKWADNDAEVKYEKFDKPPLIDTGELLAELTNPNNWDLKPQFMGNRLTLTIPDRENFTDSKYDKQDIGGELGVWNGSRTGKKMARNITARPFKDISAEDVDWIVRQLEQKIRDRYGS